MPNKTSATRTIASVIAGCGISAGVVLAGLKIAGKQPKSKLTFREKVVLITGGSRGLGFALAKELGAHGSRLALCARDSNELDEACRRLEKEGYEAAAFPCDITKAGDISTLIDRVLQRFGRIDILVNDAGLIKVGPLESFKHSDFEEAMDLMFWAPVNLTLALLPRFKAQGSGHIVNITSVGGRVSVPHLLPYSCAKFAFAGFSTGLSSELKSHGIHVLTVVPGLMRTGSYLNAEFEGDAKHEFVWFSLLGNLPGFSVAAEYAAQAIRKAIESNRYICTISLPAKILIACETLIPESTRNIFEFVTRTLLPRTSGEKRTKKGKQLNPLLNQLFQAFTVLGRKASVRLNEQ